jgi:hypothetical protein
VRFITPTGVLRFGKGKMDGCDGHEHSDAQYENDHLHD